MRSRRSCSEKRAHLEHTVAKVAAQRARVASQRAKAQQQTDAMQQLLAANVALENQTSVELANVTAQYRVQIINYEIEVGVEAAKAKNTAGEEQAVTAASAVGGQNAANQVIQAEQQAESSVTIAEVAGSAQGLAAVKAAERADRGALRLGRRDARGRIRLLRTGPVGLGPGGHQDPPHHRDAVPRHAPRRTD